MNDLDSLKKAFIVDKNAYDAAKLPDFIRQAMKYCKITSDGGVYIERPDLTTKEKIAVALIGRFLASKLELPISAEMSPVELATVLDIDANQVSARLTELQTVKIVMRTNKGTYRIAPLYVETFLSELEAKYDSSGVQPHEGNITAPMLKSKSKPQKPKFTDIEFEKQIDRIDKSTNAYIYDLPSWQLKCLAILKMAKDEMKQDGLTTPQILKVLEDKFRIKTHWPTISNIMKRCDQLAFTDSELVPGHSTARRYKIMHQGETYLDQGINEIKKE